MWVLLSPEDTMEAGDQWLSWMNGWVEIDSLWVGQTVAGYGGIEVVRRRVSGPVAPQSASTNNAITQLLEHVRDYVDAPSRACRPRANVVVGQIDAALAQLRNG